MNLFKNYLYIWLKSFLKSSSEKNKSEYSFSDSGTKHYMNSNCTLKISSNTNKKKEEIDKNLKNIIKKYINSPEKLIQFIRLKGIKVYKIKDIDKFLPKLGEEEGFLTPLKGFKALVINFIIGIYCEKRINISFTTKEMFVFNPSGIEIYTIARALYKYYGYKNKMPGYDFKSQEIFKKIYKDSRNGLNSGNISVKDIYACREALARDLESINFTIELSVEYERAKKALNKITKEGSSSI